MNNNLLVIAGPTAVGKSNLALRLAKYFNTAIISADSRQFYKQMPIGTNQPKEKEIQNVPHYFVSFLKIQQTYSVGQFEKEVKCLLTTLFKQHPIIIMAGGSGLYIESVCKGLSSNLPGENITLRKRLSQLYEKYGINILQEKLKQIDFKAYKKIDLNNSKRILRAIEIKLSTNLSKYEITSFKEKNNFKSYKILLTLPKEILNNKINKRVDEMIANGLIKEAKSLYAYKDLNALNTIGYKELFDYFDRKTNLETAIEKIKINTRRYAKKQMNWFNKNNEYQKFCLQKDGLQKVEQNILAYYNGFNYK